MGTQATLQEKQNKMTVILIWPTAIILILTAFTLFIVTADFIGYHPVRISKENHTNTNQNLTTRNQQKQESNFHDTLSNKGVLMNISNYFSEYNVQYEILADKDLTDEEKFNAVKKFVEANPTYQPPSGSIVRFDINELKPLPE